MIKSKTSGISKVRLKIEKKKNYPDLDPADQPDPDPEFWQPPSQEKTDPDSQLFVL